MDNELRADALAFVKTIEHNVEKGDGGAGMKTLTVLGYAARMHDAARDIAYIDKPTHEQASALVRASEDYVDALEREERAKQEAQKEACPHEGKLLPCKCGHSAWDHWLLHGGCDKCRCSRFERMRQP